MTALLGGMIILHSPLFLDPDTGLEIGPIQNDASLIKCTFKNELEAKTPPIVDKFLSISNTVQYLGDKYEGSSYETEKQQLKHSHRFTHIHDGELDCGALERSDTEKLDINSDVNVTPSPDDTSAAASVHGHSILLPPSSPKTGSLRHQSEYSSYSNIEPIHEPVHREVNAYYVDIEQGKETYVRAGSVVLAYDRNRRLDNINNYYWEELTNPHDDEGEYYEEGLYGGCFLKIVECRPLERREGKPYHQHGKPSSDKPHSHNVTGSQIFGSNTSGVSVDNRTIRTSGVAKWAAADHTHEILSISRAMNEVLKEASNDPANISVRIFIAKRDSAPIQPTMMVPFFPNAKKYSALRAGWKLFQVESSLLADGPVAFKGCTKGRPIGSVYDQHYHEHQYYHEHKVELSKVIMTNRSADKARKVSTNGNVVALKAHRHSSEVLKHDMKSTKARNPIHHRKVSFAIYKPD